jgi:pimeloyl-ACP methyl ester carboxylesterase
MITEHYLDNGTFYKYYNNPNNRALVVFLPAQSMSPRASWEFKLPENKTHVDYLFEAGLDVILFDPIGYGNSTSFEQYDRAGYKQQIMNLTKSITKEYTNKVIVGFSTTAPVALAVGTEDFFNKVVVIGPTLYTVEPTIPTYDPTMTELHLTIEKLVERVMGLGETLIPRSNKIKGWVDSIRPIMGDTWVVPYKVAFDQFIFYKKNKKLLFSSKDYENKDIICFVGDHDYECTVLGRSAFNRFKDMFPRAKIVTLLNSTHFPTWENSSNVMRDEIIQFASKV